jgi:hypothetical protein
MVNALNGKVPSAPPSATEPTPDSVNFFTPTKTGNDSNADPVEPEEKKPGENRPAPKPKSFPLHWGTPPESQVPNKGPLPGGYGMGSITLAHWIEANMAADDEAAQSEEKPEEETVEISKDEESDETQELEPVEIEDTAEEEDLHGTDEKDDSRDESEEESNDETSDENIAEVLEKEESEETSEPVVVVETPKDEESDTAPTETDHSETTEEGNADRAQAGSSPPSEGLEPGQGWAEMVSSILGHPGKSPTGSAFIGIPDRGGYTTCARVGFFPSHQPAKKMLAGCFSPTSAGFTQGTTSVLFFTPIPARTGFISCRLRRNSPLSLVSPPTPGFAVASYLHP